MITEEQVHAMAEACDDCSSDMAGVNYQAIRQALEAYEQSKWVKFDINNPSTYPQAGCHAFRYLVITTNGVQRIIIIAHWDGLEWFANQRNIEVYHWQPLPGLRTN